MGLSILEKVKKYLEISKNKDLIVPLNKELARDLEIGENILLISCIKQKCNFPDKPNILENPKLDTIVEIKWNKNGELESLYGSLHPAINLVYFLECYSKVPSTFNIDNQIAKARQEYRKRLAEKVRRSYTEFINDIEECGKNGIDVGEVHIDSRLIFINKDTWKESLKFNLSGIVYKELL